MLFGFPPCTHALCSVSVFDPIVRSLLCSSGRPMEGICDQSATPISLPVLAYPASCVESLQCKGRVSEEVDAAPIPGAIGRCNRRNGGAVPLRLRRGEQPGREVRRGGRSSTPNTHRRHRMDRHRRTEGHSSPAAHQGAIFTLRFARDTQRGIGLRAKARQGDVGSTQVTDTVGGVVQTMECAFDLLKF